MSAANTVSEATIKFVEPTVFQQGVGVAIGLGLVILTISFLRKFHMKEEHGLPWLLGGVVLILLSLFPPLLKLVTFAVGVGTPAMALFAGSILFLIGQSLLFSLAISKQKKQIQDLAIELAVARSGRE